jgi:hypothetical protein
MPDTSDTAKNVSTLLGRSVAVTERRRSFPRFIDEPLEEVDAELYRAGFDFTREHPMAI